MRKFICKLMVYILPFILLIGPMLFVTIWSGEAWSYTTITKLQNSNHDILVGMRYNEQMPIYKKINANYYQSDVLAIGTSRVMQFSSEYFYDFYNCGGCYWGNYLGYRNFLENLEYTPKVIILGLDSWVFNDVWNRSDTYTGEYYEITDNNPTFLSIYKSIKNGENNEEFDSSALFDYSRNIGITGKTKNTGFQYDGTYYYGDVYVNPTVQTDYQFKNTFERIENGNMRFEYGEEIDQDTIEQLHVLLDYCTDNGIYVVAFIPPFAPSIYDKMVETGKYMYIEEIESACQFMVNDYGFELYNYLDGEMLDTDEAFIDGFHGSNVVYAKIIKDMCDKKSKLVDYVDYAKVQELINDKSSALELRKGKH